MRSRPDRSPSRLLRHGKRSPDYDALGVIADGNSSMRKQHDPATNLAVLLAVHGLERARTQQGVEHDGQFQGAETRAEAALESTSEWDPPVGGRALAEETFGP